MNRTTTLKDLVLLFNIQGLGALSILRFLSAAGMPTIAYLMDNPLPELWMRDGEKPALAIINWDDKTRELIFPLVRYPRLREAADWIDVWSGNKAVVTGETLKITIPERNAAWLVKA